MLRLSPTHIDKCTRRIAKLAKAVRLIHALELNLSETFPEPDTIEPGRKPFDLQIIWRVDNPKRAAKLRKQIKESLRFENPWCPHASKTGVEYADHELRGRVRLGERTTMNLRLIIAYKE